jgi:hypothetical protein
MNHLEVSIESQNKWWKPPLVILGIIVATIIVQTLLVSLYIFSNFSTPMLEAMKHDPNLFLVQMMGDQNFMFPLIFMSSLASIVVGALVIWALYKRNYKEVINGTQKIRWNRFFYSFGVWFCLMAVYLFLSYLFNPEGFIVSFNFNSFIVLLLLSIIAIPVQASFEEFIFRGYLAQLVASWTRSRWSAIIFPSIIFGLMHIANPEVNEYGAWMMMPQYIFMGAVFGLMSILDDGIECAMGAHTANNIFLCIFLTFDGSVLPTDAIFRATNLNPIGDFISIITMSVAFIIILGIYYKWNFKVLNLKIESKKVELD